MKKLYILFFLILNYNCIIAQSEKDLLFIVNDSSVYIDEFQRVYNKNIDLINDPNQKNIDNYLDLFINYKLKLAEAYNLGMHKQDNYLKELSKYSKQLQTTYLTDKETENKFLKEAYERTRYEVNVSHVLIRLDEFEKDSSAINKLNNLRQAFSKLTTKEFNDRYNLEDKMIVEDLGYFSAFKMIYKFENIAYKTDINDVSFPFRTKFGYHILKVNDKRISLGEINVGHIMIYKNKKDSNKKINNILDSINSGTSFEYLAKKYSEDKNSSFKGGRLNPFSSGQINSIPFEKAAFDLKNKGDYSKPIETKYGWHIIKLYSKNDTKSYDDIKYELLNKLKKSSRFNFISDSFYYSLLKKYNLDYDNKALTYFNSIIDTSFFEKNWKIPEDLDEEKSLVTIINKTFSYLDFATYLEESQSKNSNKMSDDFIKDKYKSFLNSEMLEVYKNNLENDNAEYRGVLKEYREGLLLFNLMQDKIWTYNESDSLKLKEFYTANKSEYNSFEEDRGKIIGDFQDNLERNWIKELKTKYSVNINNKSVRRLKKILQND